jgi:DNA helicase HerA-like ATPase
MVLNQEVKQTNKQQTIVKNKSNKVVIKSSERVFIAGKTGSGKTTLAKLFLMNEPRLVVVDSKNSLQNWELDEYHPNMLKDIAKKDVFRVRVVEDAQALELLQASYAAGNLIVYIDEVTAIIPPNRQPQKVFIDLWQRGRARNISAWSVSQRPKSVPLTFMSEAEHYFMFRLNLEDDRKRMSEFMGKRVMDNPIDKYGFYYYNVSEGSTRYVAGISL